MRIPSSLRKQGGLTLLVCLIIATAPSQAFTAPKPFGTSTASSRSTSTQLYGLLNRFRKKRQVKQEGTIRVGDTLPSVDVQRAIDGESVDIREISVGFGAAADDDSNSKKSILVGMPGAFTPTCSSEHLPGFIQNSDKFRQLGYDTIAVVTTNDRFVNGEWLKSAGLASEADMAAEGSGGSDNDDEAVKKILSSSPVTVLCDGDGDLVKTMGLAEDMGYGVGVRSKRFCLTADEDGKVTNLLTDDGMDDCSCTSAASLLKVLSPDGSVRAVGADDEGNVAAIVGGVAILAGIGYYLMTNQ